MKQNKKRRFAAAVVKTGLTATLPSLFNFRPVAFLLFLLSHTLVVGCLRIGYQSVDIADKSSSFVRRIRQTPAKASEVISS